MNESEKLLYYLKYFILRKTLQLNFEVYINKDNIELKYLWKDIPPCSYNRFFSEEELYNYKWFKDILK
jgi:hypothetical protein